MKGSIERYYIQAIADVAQSKAVEAKHLVKKLHVEFFEIQSLIKYGFSPNAALNILGNFPSLIINKIKL